MKELDILAGKLTEHKKILSLLMGEIPKVKGMPCKYYLFLTRFKGITAPFIALYERLLEKETRQADVFDLFRADLREYIYVDVSIKNGIAFRRPLRHIVSSFDWVYLTLREFIFVFGDPADHSALFNDWKARTTPESFIEASQILVSDLMRSLVVHAIQTKQATGTYPKREEAQNFIFSLLYKEIFRAYRQDKRSWIEVEEHLTRIDQALTLYAADYRVFTSKIAQAERRGTTDFSPPVKDALKYYQLRGETEKLPGEETPFYQCGLELEFQTPLRFHNIETLAEHIRENTGMKGLSTEASEKVYLDPLGGVLTSDDSLPTLEGYFPTEYASAVIRSRKDEERVARVLRYFNRNGCAIDESAGIHIHVSREGCPLEGLQNLVLRFARLEKLIRQCSFNEQRSHDFNMYGPSLLSLYGDVKTSVNRTKNFLVMAHFVRRAKDIDALFDASSCSGRYASLFLKTKLGTMEFRGHPSTLSVKRIMNYFELTQSLVDSAMRNDKQILPRHRLRMAIKLKKIDKTKCLADPLYAICSYNKFDASDIPPFDVRETVRKRFRRVVNNTIKSKNIDHPIHNYDGQVSHRKKIMGFWERILSKIRKSIAPSVSGLQWWKFGRDGSQ